MIFGDQVLEIFGHAAKTFFLTKILKISLLEVGPETIKTFDATEFITIGAAVLRYLPVMVANK